jgi:hypothetical protein
MDTTSLALAKSYTDKRVKEIQPSDVDLSGYLSKKELEGFTQKHGFDTYKVFNIVATSKDIAYQQLQQLKVELDTGLDKALPLVFFHFSGSGWGPEGIFFVYSYNGTTLFLRALHQQEDSSLKADKGYSSLTTRTISLKVVFKSDGTVSTTEIGGTSGATKSFINPDYDYANPYMPKYAGSPATKKYVDDAIAAAITSALEGEY